MQSHAPAGAAARATTRPDVSPEAIAALVAQGAAALRLPDHDALSLLVGVTHDMRSPLSSMLMLVERLRSGQAGPLTPTQERQLGLLYSATFGLAAMTNDALDFARGTASLASEAPVAFSITDLFRSVCQVVQPIAEERGLLLRCSGPTTDRRIGQPTILHRVLLNLVTNALKYTNTGTVTLSATAVGATSLCFQVDDSGRGMPEAVAAALTTPVGGGPIGGGPIGGGPIGGGPVFSEAFSGSGLGLGICRRLLGDLDSELEIESLRPTGTRVQFTLALPAL